MEQKCVNTEQPSITIAINLIIKGVYFVLQLTKYYWFRMLQYIFLEGDVCQYIYLKLFIQFLPLESGVK